MRFQSLRTRLVAVAVALVTLGVLATGVATYLTLRGFLYERLDDQLGATARRPVIPCNTPDGPSGPTPQGFRLTALQRDGSELDLDELCRFGARNSPVQADPDDTSQLIADPGVPRTLVTTDGHKVRAIAVPVLISLGTSPRVAAPPAGIAGYEVFALSTDDVTGTLAKLLGLEAIGCAVVIAAAGVLSALGVRLGLRPLDRVTRTAREVAAELSPDGSGLDKRVEVTDPATEVGQLGVAVNTMLDAVETEYAARYESEQRMRRFLADASHELRTPLTSLRGYAELIRLRGQDGADPDARDALRRIEGEGTRMSRLVDDLLTLARQDRGAVPEWAPVDLGGVVADAVADVHAAYPDRAITLTEPAAPAIVTGDHDQLLQVVRNVLTNAAVHTPGGPITARVAAAPDEIVVTVQDAGPGLPPNQVVQVFDRFWRADSGRTRSRGGSGLGLSIVQALLAAHGGRVTFDSTPERGSTVTIRLPAAGASAPALISTQ